LCSYDSLTAGPELQVLDYKEFEELTGMIKLQFWVLHEEEICGLLNIIAGVKSRGL
jgi:hypothetical protein